MFEARIHGRGGQGKKAARCVDAYLRGGRYVAPAKHALASFDRLNAWYYEDAPTTVRPMLEAIDEAGLQHIVQLGARGNACDLQRLQREQRPVGADRKTRRAQQAGEMQHILGQLAGG